MGWPEEQTLNSDISYILSAYEGRVDMLRAIFGGGNDAEQNKPKSPEQIGGLFDSMMGGKPNPAKRNKTIKREAKKQRG